MKDEITITNEQYYMRFMPQPGFVLIKKDEGAEKTSAGIHTTRTTKEFQTIYASSGIIVVKSLIDPKEEYERRLQAFFQVGDHVGFQATNPIDTPVPPYYRLERNQDGSRVTNVMIHIEDLLGVIVETTEEREKLLNRIERFNMLETNHGTL